MIRVVEVKIPDKDIQPFVFDVHRQCFERNERLELILLSKETFDFIESLRKDALGSSDVLPDGTYIFRNIPWLHWKISPSLPAGVALGLSVTV